MNNPRAELGWVCFSFLAADYEAANMPCAAAELRRRLEWYSSKIVKGEEEVERN
jgi:hypothetical protein